MRNSRLNRALAITWLSLLLLPAAGRTLNLHAQNANGLPDDNAPPVYTPPPSVLTQGDDTTQPPVNPQPAPDQATGVVITNDAAGPATIEAVIIDGGANPAEIPGPGSGGLIMPPTPLPNEPAPARLPSEVPPPVSLPPASAPSAETAVRETTPASPLVPETIPPTGAAQGIVLNFQNASLDTILAYLSETAGFIVVRDVAVEGHLTIMSRQPITREEAITVLNTALYQKGYAAIVTGRTLRIIPLADAKKRNLPVRIGNDPSKIEPSDSVVTQIIPVRYVDAVKLRQDLAPLLPASAELIANASSNSLIMTDIEANIRRIMEIVNAVDTAVSSVAEIRVFQLRYANATNTARLINELFRSSQASRQSGQAGAVSGATRFFTARGGQQPGQVTVTTQPAASDGSRPAAQTTATADERTNTIVVSGTSETLKVIETLVKDLDSSPEAEEAVFIYKLKNGTANNVATTLNNLFGTSTASRNQRTNIRMSNPAAAAALDAAGGSSLEGQVYVVANSDTNSLMVMTASKNFDRVKEIIDDLDRPLPQVLIKVLIAEVTYDRSLDLGTEFSILNLGADAKGSVFTKFGVDQGAGMVVSLVEKDVTAALTALQKVGKLDVLSRPYILGSENQRAQITVGQRVPFITNTRTTETGQTINTIQYQDVGIILNVTPKINPEGLVILDVSPEISALTGTTVPISETVNAPVFAKRSATSRVAIQDGQTIVIGGLMEDRKTEEVKKVPLLGDIPLLGLLFRKTATNTTKTELLIFLTPHVAKQPGDLQEFSAGTLEGTSIVNKAVTPGAFEKHLKGMERGGPAAPAVNP
ncbi:MAG TPA: type II secretion system secretin GspD [bacterium]|nr:type II secretion system secretin GspD [bacterium]